MAAAVTAAMVDETAAIIDESGRNSHSIVCQRCSSKIVAKGVATLVTKEVCGMFVLVLLSLL